MFHSKIKSYLNNLKEKQPFSLDLNTLEQVLFGDLDLKSQFA